ncbi:hypothetical protein SPSYN_01069 [Sporotomaculum syntrophicum]|uniref:DUF1643 domain-containing protein n=1 Tax=Sporotomaculum syntrophicum TaxID=182264 RepID=A0A9D2WPX8_9FIRM|nr:DUF1643 domain-containing protein [Sporotomaculum syntrophicum]KAF1084933.1 hypothetical protein SPSYN_01069 [Sporotomaculum syntrophicum]
MEQIYHYKSFVRKKDIVFKGDIENNYRYLLRIPLQNEGKKVLVIMKNPSKANKEFSDLTIDRVLTFCNSEGYSEVNIINLYSYYSTDSGKIRGMIEDGQEHIAIGTENNEIIKSLVNEVDEVIVAWGSNTFGLTRQYKSRIKQVINIIKGKNLFYVQNCAGKGWYPRHAQVWSVNSGIKKYVWNPPV